MPRRRPGRRLRRPLRQRIRRQWHRQPHLLRRRLRHDPPATRPRTEPQSDTPRRNRPDHRRRSNRHKAFSGLPYRGSGSPKEGCGFERVVHRAGAVARRALPHRDRLPGRDHPLPRTSRAQLFARSAVCQSNACCRLIRRRLRGRQTCPTWAAPAARRAAGRQEGRCLNKHTRSAFPGGAARKTAKYLNRRRSSDCFSLFPLFTSILSYSNA